ncbi:hypothetical protein LPJ73_002274 [Coemansia sp. RSA 2703]|nr:hypothetical protein LPJ73_002274 [Coemansia sp. RSA 2703]KAJ2374172.1 hypothetical protein GGI05_007335 [Coemansia sp. RSA 2603]KAJ2378898.1 hypothetical protein IW150_000522 [Coemansia sp. RSA 2607]
MHIVNFASVCALVLAGMASAHMALKIPCPRYDAHGINCPEIPDGESWDWDQIEPIGRSDKIINPLCKHTAPFETPSAEWKSGETVNVVFHGIAAHSGGHSEFSISYDNGKTFAVLQQNLKYMFFGSPTQLTNTPRKTQYTITLPENLPGSDNAVFAWTWVNASGNREFYMNCVDVKIIGKAGKFTGRKMVVANYGPDYPEIPEFRGDYSTGIELYTNSHNITVTGHGNKKHDETSDSESTSTTSSDSGDGESDDTDADYKSYKHINNGEDIYY